MSQKNCSTMENIFLIENSTEQNIWFAAEQNFNSYGLLGNMRSWESWPWSWAGGPFLIFLPGSKKRRVAYSIKTAKLLLQCSTSFNTVKFLNNSYKRYISRANTIPVWKQSNLQSNHYHIPQKSDSLEWFLQKEKVGLFLWQGSNLQLRNNQ